MFFSLSLSSILALFLYSIGHYHYDIYWTFIECQRHVVGGMVMACGQKMALPRNITIWLQFSNELMKRHLRFGCVKRLTHLFICQVQMSFNVF